MQKILMLATFTGLSIFLTGNYQLLAQNLNNQVNYNNRPANCPVLNVQNNPQHSSGGDRPMGNRPNWHGIPDRQGRMMFDPNTVTTISGTIVSVDQMGGRPRNNQNNNSNNSPNPDWNNHQGIHLTLESGDQTIDIHVGPTWYLAKQNMVLNAGDQITVIGSQASLNNQFFVIAQQIKKGNQLLVLRDEEGIPMWRGQGLNNGQSRN